MRVLNSKGKRGGMVPGFQFQDFSSRISVPEFQEETLARKGKPNTGGKKEVEARIPGGRPGPADPPKQGARKRREKGKTLEPWNPKNRVEKTRTRLRLDQQEVSHQEIRDFGTAESPEEGGTTRNATICTQRMFMQKQSQRIFLSTYRAFLEKAQTL